MAANQLVFYYSPTDMSSQKVLLLNAYLGLSLKTELVNTENMAHYSDHFRSKTMQATIPILKFENGDTLNEMPAILTCLASLHCEQYNSLYPIDDLSQARINQLLEFDYNVLSRLVDEHFLATLSYSKSVDSSAIDGFTETIVWLNGHLKGRKYIAVNQFSVADIALTVTISHIKAFGITTTSYTMLNDWHERCKLLLSKYNFHVIVEIYAIEMGDRYLNKIRDDWTK